MVYSVEYARSHDRYAGNPIPEKTVFVLKLDPGHHTIAATL